MEILSKLNMGFGLWIVIVILVMAGKHINYQAIFKQIHFVFSLRELLPFAIRVERLLH